MNILPLVSAFMMLFAIGAYTLMHQWIAMMQEERSTTGSERIHLGIVSQVEEDQYSNAKGPKAAAKKPVQQKKQTQYHSPREQANLPESAKLNFALLLKEENALLYETAAELLRLLYERSAIYRPNFEYDVLDILMKTAKENPAVKELDQLLPHIQTESDLFYKLLKGTHTHSLYTSIGYPPLTDFFSFVGDAKKPINLRFASKALLIALLGHTCANQVILKEQAKWDKEHKKTPLTKAEFEELYMQYGSREKPFTKLEQLVQFSNAKGKTKPKETVVFDKETRMQLKY